MNDLLTCPICDLKLKNQKVNSYFSNSKHKIGTFIERTCNDGMNHMVKFITDSKTKKIVLLKTSLNHNYSKFLEIDFYNSCSTISCFKMGQSECINVPKILDLDFPNLDQVKEKVDKLIAFS